MVRLGIFSEWGPDGFSQIPRHLARALGEATGTPVAFLPAEPSLPPLIHRFTNRVRERAGLPPHAWEKDERRCRNLARQLDPAASHGRYDAVILIGTESAAFTRTSIPLYSYGDSIFGARFHAYPDQTEQAFSEESIKSGVTLQKQAVTKLRACFLSCRFAIEQAERTFAYGFDRTRFEVVGIGANFESESRIHRSRHDDEVLNLLWIGRDWERKGGSRALEVVRALRDGGIDARLDAVGDVRSNAEFVRSHGMLKASDPVERRLLRDAFRNADAYILPTGADLSPVAIQEAASFSVPTIATAVGGIPEMIEDGVTGLLFSEYDPGQWSERITSVNRTGSLPLMGTRARDRYEESGTWRSVAERMLERIEKDLNI